MKILHSLLALLPLCVLVLSGCDTTPETPETLHTSGYDEQEMKAAIARARGEVDAFIAELNQPTGDDHAVKAPISDGELTEHFWLSDVIYSDGHFEGKIGNDPGRSKTSSSGSSGKSRRAKSPIGCSCATARCTATTRCGRY